MYWSIQAPAKLSETGLTISSIYRNGLRPTYIHTLYRVRNKLFFRSHYG